MIGITVTCTVHGADTTYRRYTTKMKWEGGSGLRRARRFKIGNREERELLGMMVCCELWWGVRV